MMYLGSTTNENKNTSGDTTMLKQKLGNFKTIFIETINKLKGSERRQALARVAKEVGIGGQTEVAKEFNVGRDTLRKGAHELRLGIKCEDAFRMRGRKKVTEHLPELKKDIYKILEPESQTDPTFKSTKLYTRISVAVILRELEKMGYTKNELPCNQTLRSILNEMDYKLRKVLKAKPLKKIPQTDEIFETLAKIHEECENSDEIARLSIDCKDRIKIGNFSRGGKSRVKKEACDHDFGTEHITPFGILDVKSGELNLSLTKGPVTADFMVDRLREFWQVQEYDKTKKVLILNADNGPENNSRRTQFMKRIIEFCVEFEVIVVLAYYPPYHSKYNKIERVWGILEQHINGDLMDSTETVIKFCKSMTWKQKNPKVELIEKEYFTGVKLSAKQMNAIELVIDRKKNIEKWLIVIKPIKCADLKIPLRT